MSDIKNINNNIIKIEHDYRKKEKSKLKNLDSNNTNNFNKLSHARNYSQGVRNLNFGNNPNSNNVNNNANQGYYYQNSNSNLNNINNTGNYAMNLNQKLQQESSHSKRKIIKPSLTTNSNNTNNNNNNNSRLYNNKEIHLEKSFVNQVNNNNINPANHTNYQAHNNPNNVSDNDVYLMDFENSADEYDTNITNNPNIKKLQRNNTNVTVKERKLSAYPVNTVGNHINIKEEIQLYSPYRKDNNKFNSNKRDESLTRLDAIPQVRKRDLNVFLNEKSKSKGPKKVPFK